MCKAFGDPTKAKAWSKHTQRSGADQTSTTLDTDSKKVKTKGHNGHIKETVSVTGRTPEVSALSGEKQ